MEYSSNRGILLRSFFKRIWHEHCCWLIGTSCCTVRSAVSFMLRCAGCSQAMTEHDESQSPCGTSLMDFLCLETPLLAWQRLCQKDARVRSSSYPILLSSLSHFRGVSLKALPTYFSLSLILYRCLSQSFASLILSCHLLLRGPELIQSINKI